MFKNTVILTICALFIMGVAACDKKPQPQGEPESAVKSVPKDMTDPMEELQKKADIKKMFAICNGPFDAAGSATKMIGDKPYAIDGAVVKPPVDDDQVGRIGVISDIKSDSEKNREALKQYVTFFKNENVEVIVVLGDTAEKSAEIVSLLSILLDSGLPVAVITGNREPLSVYGEAAAELAGKYPNFLNMNILRVYDSEDFDIVSLPGYHDAQYVHHRDDACVYGEKEVADLKTKVQSLLDNPVLLISHGPAKGEGEKTIDYAFTGVNAGDPKITAMAQEGVVKFGLFGNIHEAGGKAVKKDMKTVVAENTPSDTLFLNVGPADTDPWSMNDGSVSYGMVAVVTVAEGKASYKMFRRTGNETPTEAKPSTPEATPAAEEILEKPLKLNMPGQGSPEGLHLKAVKPNIKLEPAAAQPAETK